MVTMTTSIQGIDDCIKDFQAIPEAAEKAIVSACNKLADMGKTVAKREITSIYNIKSSDATNSIKIEKAQRQGKAGSRMFSVIMDKGFPIPLFKFGASPQEPVSQKGIPKPYTKRRKVSVKVLKSGKRTKSQHRFLAKMKSGHIGVFYRIDKPMANNPKKQMIVESMSFASPTMFTKKAVDKLNSLMATEGLRVFQHELGYYMDRLRKQ